MQSLRQPSSQSSMRPSLAPPPCLRPCSPPRSLLERPENHHMIRWDPAGEYIIVERPEQLALHVLPSIYRQSRFASFSRQLNVRLFVSSALLCPQQICLLRSMDSCARLICATSTLPSMILTPVPGVCSLPLCPLLLTSPTSPPHAQPPLPPRGCCQFQAPRPSPSAQAAQARHPGAAHNPPAAPRHEHEFRAPH